MEKWYICMRNEDWSIFFVEVFHQQFWSWLRKCSKDKMDQNRFFSHMIMSQAKITNGSKFIPPRILISHKTLWNGFQINAATSFCDWLILLSNQFWIKILKWGAPSRWSFHPISAWGSIGTSPGRRLWGRCALPYPTPYPPWVDLRVMWPRNAFF